MKSPLDTRLTWWRPTFLLPLLFSALAANTDTKWCWDLTRNIYRFVPAPIHLVQGFHTIDERKQRKSLVVKGRALIAFADFFLAGIHKDAHLSTLRFFYKLIRNTEGWVAL